jgi:CheY-like chemotaxis protein
MACFSESLEKAISYSLWIFHRQRLPTVGSSEKAVAFLQTYVVDLVVLDMIMDFGIDGLETYAKKPYILGEIGLAIRQTLDL